MHDLVIFDCDGVLVDSEPLSNQVLVENLSRYGLDLTLEDSVGFFLGGTMTGVRDKARALGADLPADWVDEVYAETYARLRGGVDLMPGVADLLATLDERGVPFCVASNGSPDKMQITLGQNGLWDRFRDVAFSAHVLGVAKPDPTLFLTAAEQFGAKAPVVIEDSLSGVTAAMRADMRCLAYAPHSGGQKLADLGAELFTDMAQVPVILGL
ncbi:MULTISPECIES: HAD family phosphatase [unclassified Ruegeria]|uniref:HAD family hydrolase n=1 Tax=unclassified Ruegeria TaxID=2625375 RepID=UPI001AD9FBE6|nr:MULTISPECIES: HAD family phosphatase [unclassified Ruegeria]MBO9411985.1 HAD family phosphatase [Ruegeria sp. R8_1]MBO9417094.1 HAD family phosphatase [Ruegeria sp. R8_2]